MATIAAGANTAVYCALDGTMTITPGSGGRVSINGRGRDGSQAVAPRELYGVLTLTVAAGDTILIEAIGAAATYTDPNLSAAQVAAVQGLVDGDGIAAPSTNLTAAVGSAGALTGAYYYTQTFVTVLGETAPWPGTATVVNPSSQRIELSNIPIGAAGTIARRIYRTAATPTDSKDYRYVGEIADNTTTTYSDNLADGSLGDPADWNATNRGQFSDEGGSRFAAFSDQSTALGQGTFNANTGYASTAVGYQALYSNTTGRRNTAFGVYALTAVTTGYENTGLGVHAGDSLTTGVGNTMIGYDAGSNSIVRNFNVAVGSQAFNGTGETGNGNVAVGYRALGSINTADQCVGVGYFAGRYANASRQLFIDNSDRTNISNAQNIGLIYGKGEATAIAQVLHLNALTRIGPPSVTVATLPAAAGLAGYRGFVTDATVTTYASIVAGGGSNGVPVFCDGTNWRIG